MANKTRNAQQDQLEKLLADSDLAKRVGLNQLFGDNRADGTWVLSKEEFDRLYKSVDDLEKYLRS